MRFVPAFLQNRTFLEEYVHECKPELQEHAEV